MENGSFVGSNTETIGTQKNKTHHWCLGTFENLDCEVHIDQIHS